MTPDSAGVADAASEEQIGSPFFGAKLGPFEVVLVPFLYPAVKMWLEHNSGGLVFLAEVNGERLEVAHWCGESSEWITAPSDGSEDIDEDLEGLSWLPDCASQLDELTDSRFVEFLEATAAVREFISDQLSFGWKISSQMSVLPDGSPQIRVIATPPPGLDDEAVRRVAASTDCGFGVADLDWVGPPPDRWGEEWSFVAAKVDNRDVDTTPVTLRGLYVIGEATAPWWTLPAGFDRPILRHSAGGHMPESKITVTFDDTRAVRSADEIEALESAVGAWTDSAGFGPPITVARRSLGSWTSAQRSRFVKAVGEAITNAGDGPAGYYLLGFENGDSYIGQSTDIAKRLQAHLRDRPDIDSIRLMPDAEVPRLDYPLRHLLRRERELIHGFQRAKLPSRNKAEMTYRTGPSRLDEIFDEVGITAQDWLTDPIGRNAAAREHGRTPESSDYRPAGDEAMAVFARRAGVHLDQIIDIQRTYAQRCLPVPERTVMDWWVVSAPLTTPSWGTLSNLSVGWGIECLRINVDFTGWVQANAVELLGEDPSDADVTRFLRQHPGAWIDEAPYKDGGAFNVNVRAASLEVLAGLLDDTALTRAAATAALNYMRASKMAATKNAHNVVIASLIIR